jgi:putative oxidoreductase
MKIYKFVMTHIFDNLRSPLLLIGRLYIGWQLFVTGKGKLGNIQQFADYLTSLHIPAPEVNARFVASLECFGGLLLLVGLAARLIAIPLVVNFIVAYATGDHQAFVNVFKDPDAFIAATPFLYLVVCAVVLAFGPGIFSLDALIGWLRARKTSEPLQVAAAEA